MRRLIEVLRAMTTPRRDPEVVRQVAEAASDIRANSRLLREIKGLQGELERSRPSKHRQQGDVAWGSNKSSSH